MTESAELVIVGCGPAGATAARAAARSGIETVVLEKDAIVGAKRVCAAGLRPGFCAEFDLPRSIVHCDTPRLALFDAEDQEHELRFGPGHTSTREELDGTMGRLAAEDGADIRTQSLFRAVERDGGRTIVEYADLREGVRKSISARNVFLAQGATAVLDAGSPFAFRDWRDGLMTTLQYRVYLDRPAVAIAYQTLEMHYYVGSDGRQVVAWMFPKKDHLAIGLGILGKMEGSKLRHELDLFTERVRARLYPDANVKSVKVEGHLLYMGAPRPTVGAEAMMLGGTAAGLVDATNGEGIYEAAISGRMAAESVMAHRNDPLRAARYYGRTLQRRFARRLQHRLKLMNFLERRPSRFKMLFELLSSTPGLPWILHSENSQRTLSQRWYLYTQLARFALRAARG